VSCARRLLLLPSRPLRPRPRLETGTAWELVSRYGHFAGAAAKSAAPRQKDSAATCSRDQSSTRGSDLHVTPACLPCHPATER
jgi:hypothetical protein